MAAKRKGKIAAPSRPYWSGNIRMSLVSIPVNAYTATDRAKELHFHQLHKPTGKRVRYQKVVPGVGEIQNDEIVKGYEFEKGKYVVVEPEELKALRIESSSTFTIDRFVDREEIDSIYFDDPYYVAPSEESAIDAFAVIRDALKAKKKVGLGQIVLGGRERIAALQPFGKGMLLETLRYPEDLKKSETFFAPIEAQKADKAQIDLASQLIDQKAGAFEPDKFEDHYEDAVRELLEKKMKGEKIVTDEEPEPRKGAEVIDLMEALRRSVERKGGDAKPSERAPGGGGRPHRPAARGATKTRRASPRKKAAGGRH